MDDTQNPAQEDQGKTNADTSDNQTTSPVTDTADTKDTAKVSESTTQEAEIVDDKEELKKKREEGKLQQEQKEKAELQAQLNRVQKWAAQDPDRLYDGYVNTSGLSKEDAARNVKQLHPDWKEPIEGERESEGVQTPPEQQQQPVDPLYQQAAASAIEKEKALLIKKGEAAQKFRTDNPDVTPSRFGLILGLAEDLKGEADSRGDLMSHEESIKKANETMFNSDKLIKEAEERGENRGLAEASSIASSIKKSPTGANIKTDGAEPEVPDSEWRAAQSQGFKNKAEYVFYRDNPNVSVE